MRALLDQRVDRVHPASTFAFLMEREPETADATEVLRDQGLVDPAGEVTPDLDLALAVCAWPRSVVMVLDRSAAGQDLICAVDDHCVVATFFTPAQTCLLSLPVTVDDFQRRLIDDIGRFAEDHEDPALPATGLVISGQGLTSSSPDDEEVRNAMFVGPPGRRWLVVPPARPSDRLQLVRLHDLDLELLVADLMHRPSTWGSFAVARRGWENTAQELQDV